MDGDTEVVAFEMKIAIYVSEGILILVKGLKKPISFSLAYNVVC